ncbi:MAG TPA: glycerophosphodiester phosphodiesterase family protein [Armatimonadota bacterium]|nr:glycerophosphodiester phosphodiesterase family protein [Armatimonadota bacterium]
MLPARAFHFAALTAALAGGTLLAAPVRSARPAPARGYIRALPAESPEAAEARHRRVAERRSGTVVMVHRGAAAFAPENTLEAYAAAMDYGADGCEVDLRRTSDGVLVLFHDDMLDHLTNGFGEVEQITCYELLSLRPNFVYGTAGESTRPPTFAALLTLARQRAMLLHLDVKDRGLDAAIARMLDEADVWDHVVAVNRETAPELAAGPKLKPLAYKGPGLYDRRRDVDPEAVRAQLARPGQMVMVDDPRLAARELKRPGYRPVPLPARLREDWPPHLSPAPEPERSASPPAHLRYRAAHTDPGSGEALRALLRGGPGEERRQPDGSAEYRLRREQGILDRAWAAQRLAELDWGGRRGADYRETVALLERQVRERSLHRDWRLHGLDGAIAARALGRMGAVEAAPTLVEAFRRVDPDLTRVVDPAFASNPLAWTDFRVKMYILPALGRLRCDASRRFLQEYVAMPEEKARLLAPVLYEDATKALLQQDLRGPEIEALLRSENPAVRGTAILECLDHPSRVRTAALKAAASWALDLPRAPSR